MEWLRRQFEVSRVSGGSNIRAMEGMRGFAVFLVFIVHYSTLVEPWVEKNGWLMAVVHGLHDVGNTGVDLFFVLSGYLIYGTLISKKSMFVPFMKRRIVRIYPAFLAVFLIYLILSFVFPKESKIPTEGSIIYLVQNLLMLPGFFPIEPMITVAWSLSYEMFYYLAMPLIISSFSLRSHTPEKRILYMAFLTVGLTLICIYQNGPIRLLMFVSGILLYESVKSQNVRSPNSNIGFFALISGLVASILPISGYMKTGILFVCFFAFCLCCFVRPKDWLARVFSQTPVRWLGNMSYSYYLLHGLALKASFMILGKLSSPAEHGPLFFLALLPAMFALTVIPSAILFLLIERPFSLGTALQLFKVANDPLENKRNSEAATPPL